MPVNRKPFSAKTALASIEFDRSRPLQKQITNFVRDLVRVGGLKAGDRLPSIQELATVWSTTLFTVNRGLQPLMTEGYLERRRRIGTTVRSLPESNTIGIYFADKNLFGAGNSFYPALFLQLQEAILRSGRSCRLWVDTRPGDEHQQPPLDLIKAIEHRELIGLLAPSVRLQESSWIRKLHLPVASIQNLDRFPLPMVDNDYAQMFEEFARRLHEKGCRSVGFIAPFESRGDEGLPSHDLVFSQFHAAIASSELETRPEWLLASRASDNHQLFGYDQMMKLWALPNRPDALIVYPDTVVRGVLLAIWKLRLEVPKQLHLCLHRNEDLRIHCPFEVTWAETSTASFANVLFQALQSKMEGFAAPTQVLLPLRLVEGPCFP